MLLISELGKYLGKQTGGRTKLAAGGTKSSKLYQPLAFAKAQVVHKTLLLSISTCRKQVIPQHVLDAYSYTTTKQIVQEQPQNVVHLQITGGCGDSADVVFRI